MRDVVDDPYAGVARTWDADAARVYRPIAVDLVAAAPHPLAGRVVLDAGAGTGLAGRELVRAGARVVAVDVSVDMLAWHRGERPPAVAGELTALPLRDRSVDDALAAFVLNHLTAPVLGLRELARVTRPGGAVLATVYAATSGSPARDRVDETALAHGFRWPSWYLEVKRDAAPQLENPEKMAARRTWSPTGSARRTAARGSTGSPRPSGPGCGTPPSPRRRRSCSPTGRGSCGWSPGHPSAVCRTP